MRLLIFANMANRQKSKKGQTSSNTLKADKEERVTVRQIAKDERTHKITGTVLLLLAIFLFVAFTSYLFTWKEDQSVIANGISIFHPSANTTANLLGNVGAYISHIFFYKGFGVASYFLCSLFFIIGVNLLFARKIFSISRNVRYVIAGLLYFSVALAFITNKNGFPWGGEVGDMISDWLIGIIGKIGTASLLFVAGLAYIIWRFNPVFKVPSIPKKTADFNAKNVTETEDAKLFIDESFSDKKGNSLKGESGIVVIPPKKNEEQNNNADLKLVEKDDDEFLAEELMNDEFPAIKIPEKKSAQKK